MPLPKIPCRAIIDTVTSDPRIRPHVDARSGVLLAGHSRGGKLSVLAAASDPRVRGVALLDPVDNTPMTPSGEGVAVLQLLVVG